MSTIQKIEELLNSVSPARHTFFQLNFFVIGKEPTTQAKIHRCLEETKIRKVALDAIDMQIDDLEDTKILLSRQHEITSIPNADVARRQIARKIKSTEMNIEQLKVQKKATTEELEFFYQAYLRLVEKEPRRDWDDVEVQLEYWNAKLGQDIRTKLIMSQPIDSETLKTVFALPDSAPVKQEIIGLIKKSDDYGPCAILPDLDSAKLHNT